jgi:co-chaperonin GroES (HSP10)
MGHLPGREASRNRADPSALPRAAAKAESKFNRSTIAYDNLGDAFPAADPGLVPFGSDVLVQLRTPRRMTAGGIALAEESRETDQWNTQVAKVIAFGPVCFCNRETLAAWPEGAWCVVGDYVRVPKYGGDRWWVDAPGSIDGKALFVLVNDLDLKGRVPPDKVLDMVAYI